jgi:hypothetical protein
VVDILVEDSKQYGEALEFIWHQDPETVRPSFLELLHKWHRGIS